MKLRALFGLFILTAAVLAADGPRMEARVYVESPEQASAKLGDLFGELDICTVSRTDDGRDFLVVNADAGQLAKIEAAGLRVEVTWPDIRDKFRKMTGVDPDDLDAGRNFGYFFTYWEMIDTLRRLAALYPQILDTFKLGPSFQGRALWGVRISDNPTVDEPEPELFINGATHAREPLGTHACINFASLLCQNYGTDSLVTWLVRNREFYIIPVMNPDGYVYNSDSGGASSNWRKNRRGPVSPYVGIDLNRNYGYKWGYDNYGSSPTPSYETYRGPSRFSEPETRTIRSLLYAHKFRTTQDFHTYGRYNLCAWGYMNPMPPDSLVLKEMCDTLRANNGYTQTGPIYRTIYPTNGGSSDYGQADTLKDSSATERKFITYSFSSELGINDFWYGWNDSNYVNNEVNLNIPNLYYLARVSGVFFDSMRTTVNDSAQGNRTLQLDPNETANLWFRVRNRAIHPLDSAYSISGRLRSLDTMVTVLDSIKSFPLCRRRDSTDNRAAQFRVYCKRGASPGRVVPLRLELTYRDDTLTMMQPVSFTITIGTNPIYNHDVGCTRLLAPAGSVDSGASVVPACSVYNYGDVAESYVVRMRVGAYNRTDTVLSHAPGSRVYVTFPAWSAGARGTYAVTCSTELATDTTRSNDRRTGTVTVDVKDVACVKILAPADSVDSGVSVTPACSVRNYGTTTPASYTVRMKVGSYNQTAVVSGQAPGTAVRVTFPNWTASPPGTFAVTCSTELAVDQVGVNDRQNGSVRVKPGSGGPPPPPPGGWTARNPMPTGAKAIKDGGWLAYDASKARIYATRGQKQPDFYAYAPQGDSWGVRAPWLLGTEGKLPQKGSVGCADGSGYVYATKGNNTSGFYKYDANANAWAQKRDVPLGLSNKKVKGGTDIAWAIKGSVGSPYLLKGYKNEFYRYDTGTDSWQTLTPAPVGVNGKWDKGSWLAYDGVKTIYAHKAKYHELWKYDTERDSWSPTMLAGMPIPGSAGSKKAKDGCCGSFVEGEPPGGCFYALKGGNTREFWQYKVAANSWAEKETIPTGMFKKKVKAGADIVAVGTVLYATKGNKSNEFWMYTPGATVFAAPQHDGVLAERLTIDDWRLTIAPNPLAAGFVSVRLSSLLTAPFSLRIYDAAGRCVGVWKPLLRSGAADLDMRHLAAGVYLVRVEMGSFVATQKLVVQR
jgi:hypothetical protein